MVSARLAYAPVTQDGEEMIAQWASSLISMNVGISAPSTRAHADLVTPLATTDTSVAHAFKDILALLAQSLFVLEIATMQAIVLPQEFAPALGERWAPIAS